MIYIIMKKKKIIFWIYFFNIYLNWFFKYIIYKKRN